MVIETWNCAKNNPLSILFLMKDVPDFFSKIRVERAFNFDKGSKKVIQEHSMPLHKAL